MLYSCNGPHYMQIIECVWQLGFDMPMPIYTHRTTADGPPRVGL